MSETFSEPDSMIALDRVSVAFQRPVLTNVSITVARAEMLAVVGESGTGKSTLLRLILGLQAPDRGMVTVHGTSLRDATPKQLRELRADVGMVFQGAALFDSLTTFENVAFALREAGEMSDAEISTRVRETLELVDLAAGQVSQRLPAELSGGMRKRVGIARAIANRPTLLLYDEPTAGLDPLTSGTVTDLMQRLQRELQVTSVVVSHDVRAMMRIADRVGLLHEGSFAFLGAPEAMRNSDEPYTQSFLAAA
jgi:phospholipid/cholesterol/gamma-HCH transport system ATP-binding protein